MYYYDVPNKNTRIYLEVVSPPSVIRHARLNRVEGTREGFTVGEIITLTRNDVISVETGEYWRKQLSSGDLKVQVSSLTSTNFSSYGYEVTLDNLKYNNMIYTNSNKNFKPVIMRADPVNKNIQNSNAVLTLEKQIINQITFGFNRLIDSADNLNIGLLLKRKKISY